jgi:GntR family transcriptional repressor for pyruvate dehydrogenase complex
MDWNSTDFISIIFKNREVMMTLNRKSYEIVAEELEKIIRGGIVQPGERLDSIENLAKQYRVGRSTIREALSQLKARGLVEIRHGGGTFVSESFRLSDSIEEVNIHDEKELFQLLQVRKLIEVGCIELAAKYRTEQDLLEMEHIIRIMEAAVGNEQMSQIYDVNFHMAIAKATQNPFLQSMMDSISTTMMHTIQETRKLWLYSESKSAQQLFGEHERMYKAIRAQNEQMAVEVMKKHLTKIESYWLTN